MKEFKPRDKLTQRMTRDGAVLDNQTTGEEIHISERDAEKQLSPDGQPVQMGKRDAPMNPAEDALASEDSASEAAQTYANIIAVRAGDENSPKTQALLKALKTDAVKQYIADTYNGAVVASF